jgi:hypothetical protein
MLGGPKAPAGKPLPRVSATRHGVTGINWRPATGSGLMVKLDAPDVPPPGAGLTTVTCAVPAELMSEAVMLACNWVELT